MAEQMAIRVHRYGGAEELRLEQIPRPEPGAGELLVQIHAAGILPAEWKMRQGLFRNFRPATFPYIPGSAFAGMVEAIGPGASGFQQGQAVFGRTNNGAYAEYTTLPAEADQATFTLLAAMPAGLSFQQAATISG